MSGKRTTIAVIGLGLLSTLIVMNAVYWQSGRHPAPIGLTRHKVQSTAQSTAMDDVTASIAKRGLPAPSGQNPAQRQKNIVTKIQGELKNSGFFKGEVDGIHGAITRDAIKTYQQSVGVKSTGKPSAELLGQLRFSRKLSAPTAGDISAGPSKAVELIQSGLAELGYTPGPVDGVLGADTRKAIREFERDRGLKVTGMVSVRLLKELHKVTGISVLNAG